MSDQLHRFIAFHGHHQLCRGTLEHVALRVRALAQTDANARVIVFNAQTSELIDFDCRGTPEQMLDRLRVQFKDSVYAESIDGGVAAVAPAPVGPGRPRLGVVAREVTLLPRHWQWLATQPGGASVTLRKLVEQARLAGVVTDCTRQAQNSAYRFMSAMAGNLAGFEDAARALFAGQRDAFSQCVAAWPADVRSHLQHLADAALAPESNPAEKDMHHA